MNNKVRALPLFLLAVASSTPSIAAQAPVFAVTPSSSAVTFDVKSSISIAGKFDKWEATLMFTSPDVTTGVLDIKVQAASGNTDSGIKDGKLKSKDFFDADKDL